MKTKIVLICVSFIALIGLSSGYAQEMVEMKVDSIPTNLADFGKFRDSMATNPQGAAATFVTALLVYARNNVLGQKALSLVLDKKFLTPVIQYKYQGFIPDDEFLILLHRFRVAPYFPNSYVLGTSVKSNYDLPARSFSIRLYKIYTRQNGNVEMFLRSSGADNARRIILKKSKDGFFRVVECREVFSAIKLPERVEIIDPK